MVQYGRSSTGTPWCQTCGAEVQDVMAHDRYHDLIREHAGTLALLDRKLRELERWRDQMPPPMHAGRL